MPTQNPKQHEYFIPVPKTLYRGERRLRVALVGIPNSGKSTLFNAVSATSIHTGELAGTHRAYGECTVQVGLDEASVIDLPSIHSLRDGHDDLVALKYLLWGDELPPVSKHEPDGPPAPYSPPDVIVQVIDASALERHLELTLELTQLGRPMVIALNRMDEAQEKGMHINVKALSKQLGIPVVPTIAVMGHGIAKLFTTAVESVRKQACPLPQQASQYICDSLKPLGTLLNLTEILDAFRVPPPFLLMQIAENDRYFMQEMEQHFPEVMPELLNLRAEAELSLPRALDEEIHADRHHRAATLFETVSRVTGPYEEGRRWHYWLDELFLHPHWGLLGSMLVFAMVLFMVFEVSVWLDSLTAAKLIDMVEAWQPQSTGGVVGRAVVDGLIGLIGIVVPYMIPLVMLLVALEEMGVMQRIAFVVDRGFHKIGLHGGVALPFLLGLGCNVPAISATAGSSKGRERVVASLLITFVPCSARSAIILALAGKYLGGIGVFAIFMLTIIVIAIMGRVLTRRYTEAGPGQVIEIPSYTLPDWRTLFTTTWARTSDILTIVTPLLVGGSVVLALLAHIGADQVINTLLTPITAWWLGLPVVLGVPILFGILRKELSLLMVYQAMGTFEIGTQLDWVQITTFLIFLTFYIPCISTFAVMLKTIGRKEALFSIFLSVSVALLVSGLIRLLLEGLQLFT